MSRSIRSNMTNASIGEFVDEMTERGTPIRPPSSSLFCMSSADRYKNIQARRVGGTSPFRFTITKNESLLNGFFSRIALTEIRFPWTLPNISESAGTNTIRIVAGTDDHVITVADSFYTPAELAAEITSEWNATPGVTTNIFMSFNKSQGIFVLASSPPGSDVSIYPNPAITTGYKQMYDLMNWPIGAQTPDLAQLSGVTSLRWTDYIDIVATQLTYNQELKDTSSAQIVRDMLCRLYLDETMISDATYESPNIVATTDGTPANITIPTAGYGAKQNGARPCIIYRQFQTPKMIKWNRVQPIGQVQFEVYDDQGRCLADVIPGDTLFAGNDWNFTMLVSEV